MAKTDKLGRYRKGVYNPDYGPKTPRDEHPPPKGHRTIVAKYPGKCGVCGRWIAEDTVVWFNTATRRIKHTYPCRD